MLPKLEHPIYELTLPISEKKIKFRPFLVKEQKLLMMALESEDEGTMLDTIKQIIVNCLITPLDVDKLPVVEIEYFFLNLRARSVGEQLDVSYKCENEIDGKKCNHVTDIKMNLLDIKIKLPKEKHDIIHLTNKIGIKMKYPDYELMNKIKQVEDITQLSNDLLANCIEYIFDDDNVYRIDEIDRKEFDDFVGDFNSEQYKKIEEYFETLPSLKESYNYKCAKCGFEHTILLDGLEDFFD